MVLFTWQFINTCSGDHAPRVGNGLLQDISTGGVRHLLLIWVPLLLPLLLLCPLQEVVEGVGLGAGVGGVEGKWCVELALVPAVAAALGAGGGVRVLPPVSPQEEVSHCGGSGSGWASSHPRTPGLMVGYRYG